MVTAKHVTLKLGWRLGLLRLMQLARRRQPLILTFHRFSGEGHGHPEGLPIDRFDRYMQYLARRHRVVALGDLMRQLRDGTVRPNTVVVTVDDGFEDFFSLAAPVLRRHGVPASIFVISEFVEGRQWPWSDRLRFVFERAPARAAAFMMQPRPTRGLELHDGRDWRTIERDWRERAKTVPADEQEERLARLAEACGVEIPVAPPPEYRPMTWAQLRTLAAQGFDVGAHTRTHPILSRVGPRQLWEEVGGCKEQIEGAIGGPVAHFAYPNGRRQDYTRDTVAAVARAGYTAAVTTIPGTNTPDTPVFELRRIGGDDEDLAHFAQSVSGLELLKMRVRRRLRA